MIEYSVSAEYGRSRSHGHLTQANPAASLAILTTTILAVQSPWLFVRCPYNVTSVFQVCIILRLSHTMCVKSMHSEFYLGSVMMSDGITSGVREYFQSSPSSPCQPPHHQRSTYRPLSRSSRAYCRRRASNCWLHGTAHSGRHTPQHCLQLRLRSLQARRRRFSAHRRTDPGRLRGSQMCRPRL